MHKSTIEIDRQIRKAEADHGNHLGDMIVRGVVGASFWMSSILLGEYTIMHRLTLVVFFAALLMAFLVSRSLKKAREASHRIAELHEKRKAIIASINIQRELIRR